MISATPFAALAAFCLTLTIAPFEAAFGVLHDLPGRVGYLRLGYRR